MEKTKVVIVGYGNIGHYALQAVEAAEDMELVGIADLAPTLSLQALRERDMIGANGVKYNLYCPAVPADPLGGGKRQALSCQRHQHRGQL